jgi:hypothetical protein
MVELSRVTLCPLIVEIITRILRLLCILILKKYRKDYLLIPEILLPDVHYLYKEFFRLSLGYTGHTYI